MDEPAELEALQQLAWWYNWGPSGDPAAVARSSQLGIEFVPMQWGKWNVETLSKDIDPDSKHLLGFNEPGHIEQANLEPQQAATLWPQLEAIAHDMDLKLGTPSPAPCGSNCVRASPFQWWDEFFAACEGCHFDFLATHLYTCNPQVLQGFLNECKKYRLPIWLTEFSYPNGHDGTVKQQQTYMTAALQILHAMPIVQRHAWFAPRTSGDWLGSSPSLLQPEKAELTSLGKQYVGRSAAHFVNDSYAPNNQQLWSDLCGHCFQLIHLSGLPHLQLSCQDCGFYAGNDHTHFASV